jgi:hypothetical protein
MAFGECGRVWPVPQMAEFWRMRVWRVFKMLLASSANLGTYISYLVLCTKHLFCMVYLILHKFAKLAKFTKFAKFTIVLANLSLASTTKGHSLANSSLASLKDFRKWPFWRVLEFDKIGEFLASTRIRQIRQRVAIAWYLLKIPKNTQVLNYSILGTF